MQSSPNTVVKIIPKTFFITGLGRSGTKFIATLLAGSAEYRVTHEWHTRWLLDDGQACASARFPLRSFWLDRLHDLQGGAVMGRSTATPSFPVARCIGA